MRLALALLLAAIGAGDAAAQGAPRFESAALDLAPSIDGLATLDRDGDGAAELLVARESGLELLALNGKEIGTSVAKLDRGAARTLAWCVARHGNRDAVWLARDDGTLLRWEPGSEPVAIGKAGSLMLPTGVLAFPFARDLNGDGRTDVALPEATGLRLWFANEDGTLRRGALVRHRLEAVIDLPTPEDARPEVAVSLSIPSFDVEDDNGDGFPDLAFEAEDRLQFFWSGAGGALPEKPTFEVDLDELKQKLQTTSTGLLDPANLFKAISNLVNADVRDLDGDGLADLLLTQGPKVSIFAGTRGGVDRAKAAQVLKTSGNLIAAFSADDNRDGKLDLCMLQAADISIGEVLLWVVVGGKLELDLFTYFQEERLRFAKHPSKRRKIVIDVPAILGLAAELRENEALKRMGEDLARVPVALDLDGDGVRKDVAQLERDGTVSLYRGVAPVEKESEQDVWRAVTDRFDREAKGSDEIEIELLGVVDWLPVIGGRMRAAIAGQTRIAVAGTAEVPAGPHDNDATRRLLVVLDLDGDKRDDLLLVDPGERNGPIRLEILRTR